MLGFAALGCGGATLYIDLLYMNTRPRVMRPELGRIYSWNDHGTVAYLTQGENYTLIAFLIATAILFALAIGAHLPAGSHRDTTER